MYLQSTSISLQCFCFLCRRYGVAGGRYTPVFLWKHRLPYGQYSFLSIDASPSPGPKRPYNFFGVLDDVSDSVQDCSIVLTFQMLELLE